MDATMGRSFFFRHLRLSALLSVNMNILLPADMYNLHNISSAFHELFDFLRIVHKLGIEIIFLFVYNVLNAVSRYC